MPTTLTLHPTEQVLAVPLKWADVTLAQFVALEAPEPGDTRRKAEILLGLPAGGLDALAADDVKYLAALLDFATDPEQVLELAPTPGLPDIGSLPYGCLLLAQQHIEADADRPWLVHGPYLLALYRVQLAYGKYDEAKVAACEAALLAAPVTESYADMAFFLSSYRAWQTDTSPTKPTTLTPMTPSRKPGTTTFRTALARYWASIWRAKAASSTTPASSKRTPIPS